MGKRIIECAVNNEYVIGGGVPIGAEGSHDDVVLRVAFGEMWAGLNIYATFTDALGQNPTVVLLVPSMLVDGETMTYDVTIPASAKKIEGKMVVSLTGYVVIDGTEGSATNTTTTSFRVLPSKVALADDGSVDATLAQQIHNEINQFDKRMAQQEKEIRDLSGRMLELIDNVQSKLDNGEFKGEKGDSPTIQLFETDDGIMLKVINLDGSEYEATLPDYLLDNATRAEDISV